MIYHKTYQFGISQIILFAFLLLLSLVTLNGEDNSNLSFSKETDTVFPEYIPFSPLIFNPFPSANVSLIQPQDSLRFPKGIIDFSFGQKKLQVNVSWDWSLITIS